MSLHKTLLATVLCGSLAATTAAQALELGIDPPRVYALELEDGTTLSDPDDDVRFRIGYNFSAGEVRFGRYECTGNMTMGGVTLGEAGGNVALGEVNGEGSSALFFSMTGNGSPSSFDSITVDASNTLADADGVRCAFSIYDQPSQAQAGGAAGRIHSTGWQDVIARAPGFVFGMDPAGETGAVADVEASGGAYFDFVPADRHESNRLDGMLGNLRFEAVPGVLDEDGAQVQLPDIFTADTAFSIEGDTSAWNPIITCVPFASMGFPFCTDDIHGDVVTWHSGSTPFNGVIVFFASGFQAVEESGYTARLLADTQPGYVVSGVGPVHVGEITHNGTQLQAPLVQVPGAGWLSRMVLTNTGNAERGYRIRVTGEKDNIIGTANTTGTVPANGTVVVDLGRVMTGFSEGRQRRGTLDVTLAAPSDQIQGLYQIVNATTGSISNHVMVRPGTD